MHMTFNMHRNYIVKKQRYTAYILQRSRMNPI